MLGPSEGGLGGQDAPDRFPASGRNAYPSGANAFFADARLPSSERTHPPVPYSMFDGSCRCGIPAFNSENFCMSAQPLPRMSETCRGVTSANKSW